MNSFLFFLAAVLAGIISADMFVRAWHNFLECAACVVLLVQKKISFQVFIYRLMKSIPFTILFSLLLILCFKVYFMLGYGREELEQLGYFIGAVPRTGFYLVSAGRMIDALFKP